MKSLINLIFFNIVVSACAAFVAYAIGADPQLTAKNFLYGMFVADAILIFLAMVGAFD